MLIGDMTKRNEGDENESSRTKLGPLPSSPLVTKWEETSRNLNGGESGLFQNEATHKLLITPNRQLKEKNFGNFISLKIKLEEKIIQCYVSDETNIGEIKTLIKKNLEADLPLYFTMQTQFLRDNLTIRDYEIKQNSI